MNTTSSIVINATKRPDGKDDYSDIISLPHPEIPYHPRMSIKKRAAQFAPFAALSGLVELYEFTREEAEERLSR